MSIVVPERNLLPLDGETIASVGMSAWIFSHLQELATAFKTPQLTHDPKLAQAWQTLAPLEEQVDGLGFKKRQPLDARAPERLRATQKLLREHGQELSEQEVAILQARADADQVRRRFWVQASLSFLVVAACLAMLWRGPDSEQMQKALFALLGTVVGYWLR